MTPLTPKSKPTRRPLSRRAKIILTAVLAVSVSIVVGIQLIVADKNAQRSAEVAKIIDKNQPDREKWLLKVVDDYRGKYLAADTDIKKATLRSVRGAAICIVMNGYNYRPMAVNWIGVVKSITTMQQGTFANVEIGISDQVTLATYYNPDAKDEVIKSTLVPANSNLFNELSDLKEGDVVKFSAAFLTESLNCINEQSGDFQTAMTAPAFSTIFLAVEKFPTQPTIPAEN